MERKSVFKNKNYLLLFQGTITSNIAATFYSFALSFYILDITNNNAFMQGLYLSVIGLTFVLFSFVGGVLADRWDKVKIIYLSDFLKGLIILLSIIPLYFFIKNNNSSLQLLVIFVIGIISNIIASIFNPASAALIPQIVKEEQYQQANSYFSVSSSLISILGIIIAAILYSLVPIIIIFVIVGSLYILSGISEIYIKLDHVKNNNDLTIKSVVKDFKEGLNTLYNIKPIFYIILGAVKK